MKRHAQVFLLAALIAVFGGKVRSADAYSQYSVNKDATNCRACHGDYRASPYTSLSDGQSWGNLHDLHRNTMLGGDCSVCHTSTRFPAILDSSNGGSGLSPIACVGCHCRLEDAGHDNISGGYGAGLCQHHTTSGVNDCKACHTDADPVNYTPVGEDVLPPYYANPGTGHPNMPTDPCNLDGNEDFAGSAEGLDNDGDDIYDGLDPDCAALVPDIAVTDSVAPENDLQMPFGIVTVGSSADQTVTVTNAGSDDLALGTVASANPLAPLQHPVRDRQLLEHDPRAVGKLYDHGAVFAGLNDPLQRLLRHPLRRSGRRPGDGQPQRHLGPEQPAFGSGTGPPGEWSHGPSRDGDLRMEPIHGPGRGSGDVRPIRLHG